MPRKKKSLLRRLISKGALKLKSLTVNAGLLSVTFEASSKTRLKRKKVVIRAPVPKAKPLNPIQAAFLPKIAEAKKQGISDGNVAGVFGLGALEYYIMDPSGFRRYLRDLDRLFE